MSTEIDDNVVPLFHIYQMLNERTTKENGIPKYVAIENLFSFFDSPPLPSNVPPKISAWMDSMNITGIKVIIINMVIKTRIVSTNSGKTKISKLKTTIEKRENNSNNISPFVRLERCLKGVYLTLFFIVLPILFSYL